MLTLLVGLAVALAVLHVISAYSEDRIRERARQEYNSPAAREEREQAERTRKRRLRLDRQWTREARGKVKGKRG